MIKTKGEEKEKKQWFRIRNNKTNEWWDGMATDDYQACAAAGWQYEDCYIRVKTKNGCGGWGKFRKEKKINTNAEPSTA